MNNYDYRRTRKVNLRDSYAYKWLRTALEANTWRDLSRLKVKVIKIISFAMIFTILAFLRLDSNIFHALHFLSIFFNEIWTSI